MSSIFPELPGIDQADGLRRMMNKPQLYEKVLRDFHARFVGEARVIRTAIDTDDMISAERRAHSTKGLAGTISAQQLQEAAKQLETALREGDPERERERLFTEFESELNRVIDGIALGFGLDRNR